MIPINKSLKLKMMVVILIGFILPLVLMNVTTYLGMYATINQHWEEVLIQKTAYVKEKIYNYLSKREAILDSLSINVSEIVRRDEVNQKGKRAQIKKLVCNSYDYLKYEYDILDIYVVYGDGMVDCGSSTEGLKLNDTNWYKEALQKTDVVYGNVYTDGDTKKNVVIISKSIKSNDSNIVMGVVVSISQLGALLKSEKIGTNGYSFMVDKEKRILFHPNYKFNDDLSKSDTLDSIDSGNLIDVSKQIMEGNQGILRGTIDGQFKIIAASNVTGSNMYVVSALSVAEYMEVIKLTFKKILITTLVGSIGVMLFIYFVIDKVVRVIKNIMNSMNHIANGDLTIQIPKVKRKDELKKLNDSIELMLEKLRVSLSVIMQAATTVQKSSELLASNTEQSSKTMEQISLSNSSLTTEFTEIQKDIKSVVPSIEQIGKTIRETVEIVDTALEVSNTTVNVAKMGANTIDEAIKNAIDVVDLTSGKVSQSTKKLNINNSEIQKLSSLVKTIAENINLLALNARIEAAKVGDAGKGFAVVANEMRKLSEATKNSVIEIGNILVETGETINNLTVSFDEQCKAIEEFKKISDETKSKFMEIVSYIGNNKEYIIKVCDKVKSLNEQESKLGGFLQMVVELAEKASSNIASSAACTEEQNASIEEIAAYAEELSDVSKEMTERVKYFKIQ